MSAPQNKPPVGRAPIAAVATVVFDADGRVLLVRRKRPPHQGRWTVPGGRIEPGETLRQAARREVAEETGLEVTPREVVFATDLIDAEHGVHFVIIDLVATVERAEPVAGDDAEAARFVAAEELAAYDLIGETAAAIAAAEEWLARQR